MFSRRHATSNEELLCKTHGLVVWRKQSCVLCRGTQRERDKRKRVMTMLGAFAIAALTSGVWLSQPRSVARATALTAALVDASTDWQPAATLRDKLIAAAH